MIRRRFNSIFQIISIFCGLTFGSVIFNSLINNILNKSNRNLKVIKAPIKSFILDSIKKDWHDRLAMAEDLKRIGLGEHGKSAKLSNEDISKEKEIYDQNGFNGLLSDKISLNRSLPDIRNKGCNTKTYLSSLPSVSVIIPFYNEHWSTLFRSVYSILNRSPPELIYEIILVNDFSDKEFLGEKLANYIDEKLPKVKILWLNKRSGLITARLEGAKLAKAEVLIFLDSHIEANYNWLPPLLEPIAKNYKTVVCPFIDIIDNKNFEYTAQDDGARGVFDWYFFYKRLKLLPEDLKDRTKPFRSPIMAGGLFAISAKFFWELGGYDEGLDIWGGEQYELSFKIWMCGGELIDIPCSRVGHVYRGQMIPNNPRKTNFIQSNFKRVAEVWMDEYAQYLYNRNPNIYNTLDPGDLTKQKLIRKRLHCKSFKWFMEEIAFDLIAKYPLIEPPDYANGAIQSLANKIFCLGTLGNNRNNEIGLFTCADNLVHPQNNQNWQLSWYKDLKLRNHNCLDVSVSLKNAPVILYSCHQQKGHQLWFYDQHYKWLRNGNNGRCLEANFETQKVYINDCNKWNKKMKWKFGYVNVTAMKNYQNPYR